MRRKIRFSLLPAAIAFAAFFIVLPQSGADARIHIRPSGDGWYFAPGTASVKLGGRVAFVNDTTLTHTATAQGWDAGDVQPGQTKLVTVTEKGALAFACRYHKEMTGTLNVG